MHSHADLPTTIVLQDRIRVFLAFRDAAQIGRVGRIDVDRADPTGVYGVSDRPCLDIGRACAPKLSRVDKSIDSAENGGGLTRDRPLV